MLVLNKNFQGSNSLLPIIELYKIKDDISSYEILLFALISNYLLLQKALIYKTRHKWNPHTWEPISSIYKPIYCVFLDIIRVVDNVVTRPCKPSFGICPRASVPIFHIMQCRQGNITIELKPSFGVNKVTKKALHDYCLRIVQPRPSLSAIIEQWCSTVPVFFGSPRPWAVITLTWPWVGFLT